MFGTFSEVPNGGGAEHIVPEPPALIEHRILEERADPCRLADGTFVEEL